ncbi:MAG TPA: hypothetical protein VLL52_10235 [Anaerolineae bacterium]|nr:hypothetical protein [Anaerolineae bacterium]
MSTPEETFWQWFLNNEERIFNYQEDQDAVLDELSHAIQQVHSNLTFALSAQLINGMREFIVSANGIQTAFPHVEKLVDAAPLLGRWQWIKFRPRHREILNIRIDDHHMVRADDVHYLMFATDDKVGIFLFFDNYTPEQHELYAQLGFLFLDQALGEYDIETKVGPIELYSRDSDLFAKSAPLRDLPAHFDAYWASKTS